MKKKLLSILLLCAVLAATNVDAAVYTISYYDPEGSLVSVKSFERKGEIDINDYVDFYKPDNCDKCRVYKWEDNKWDKETVVPSEIRTNMSYVDKAPNVSDEMCSWRYWSDKKSGDLILSDSEISEINRRIMNDEKTMMNDLDNLADTYNGVQIKKSEASFVSPSGMYIDGTPVEDSYYESIRKNITDAELTEQEKVRYAVCTTRTELKAYPYSDWLSDSVSDPEWDNFVTAAVLVGEPLVLYNTTADGRFVYAKSTHCEGWVELGDIAVCKDKEEWVKAKTHENILVVTGERVWLEPSYDDDISKKQLTMGTVLELAEDAPKAVSNRLSWNNYTVKLPVRNADGSYGEKYALISSNRDVNVGYLPYTSDNILKQAFKSLGNRYGWGGMLDSQDCSSFVREVYLCFGLVIPRNTTWQSAMPVQVTDISGMTDEEKKEVLDNTPPGAILIWPAHEMIYLGEENGLYYTINDVSSLVDPSEPDKGIIRPRSVIVNDLSTLRGNGTTWLSNLTKVVVVK